MIYVVSKIIKKESIFSDMPLFYIVLFLIVAYVVSFANTPWFARESALRRFSIFISCVMVFYIVINSIRSKKAIIRTIDVITVACFLEALVVIYQLMFPTKSGFLQFFGSRVVDLDQRYSSLEKLRIVGTFGFDFGTVSEFFAMNIALQFFRIQTLNKSLKRRSYIICLLVTIIALVATGTRGGIMAMFLGMLITMFMAKKYLSFTKNFFLVFIVGVLLFSIMIVFAENLPYVANLYERFIGTEFQGVVPDTRVEAWTIIKPIIMEHPLIGHGPYAMGKGGTIKYMNPHNTYFYYLFNIGIIGLLGVLWFFGGVLWHGLTAFRKQCDHEMKYILIGLIGAFMVFVIDELSVSYLRHSNMQQFVWIVFGLVVSASRIAKKDSSRRDTDISSCI